MSIKVAIASSNGINIDLHFGQAKAFFIYELKDESFSQIEKREALIPEAGEASAANSPDAFQDFGGGCGSGNGCGSGCGGFGGGCGGGAGAGPLSPNVELLLDCRAIVAAQIGQNIRRQFERNAISVFDIELPIEEALNKLAAYYLKEMR